MKKTSELSYESSIFTITHEKLAIAIANSLKNWTREETKVWLLGIADVDGLIIASDIARWIARDASWVSELLREARKDRAVLNNTGAYI